MTTTGAREAKITPCLWFDGQAEEAAHFYVSVFERSRITDTMRFSEGGPFPAGTVLSVSFELDGQPVMALNGGPQYKFTPALSLFVGCETQEEVDRLWNKLVEGGRPGPCAWLDDRFGVSWQIVPRILGRMLKDPDPAKAGRVMQAMMTMSKIDIVALKRAYEG
jgi:predicted 3-demethylubiquinone-9 3-methyltransferase (glyoxalase superfamily)